MMRVRLPKRLLAGMGVVLALGMLAIFPAPGQATPSAKAVAADVVIFAAGDISPDPSSSATGDIVTSGIINKAIANEQVNAVLALGDEQYEDGALTKFQSAAGYNGSWGAFRNKTCPAPGNHEYKTANAAGYFSYFGNNASCPFALTVGPVPGVYAFNLGGWRLYSMNSDCGREPGGGSPSCTQFSPQLNWFKSDLEAHTNVCKLAYWHHPRFATHAPFGDDSVVDQLWNAFAHRGGDVVLSGHNHAYERFTALDTNGQPNITSGMRELIVGTGGRSHIAFTGTVHAGSKFRDDTLFGVVRMKLTATGWSSEFRRENNTIVDKVAAGCSVN
jgi:Calcineurin-like phosphoesterase